MAIAEGTKGRASAARGSRTRRGIGAALLALALVSFAPRPARAELSDLVWVVVIGTAAVVVVDGVFLVHDAAVAINKKHPFTGWSVAEVAVMAPQAVFFNAMGAIDVQHRDADGWALYPSLLTGAMLTHGIWSLGEDPEAPRPYRRFLASGAIGVNGTLSVAAIAALTSEWRVFTRSMGVAEVVLTLPQVAVGAVELFADPENRPIWGAFTAWSGVLLAHGITSIALGGEEEGQLRAPSLSVRSPSAPASGRRVRAIEPRILGAGPTPLGGFDGHAPGVGFMVRGSF